MLLYKEEAEAEEEEEEDRFANVSSEAEAD
jgi:hypothetical protein